jgi:hypothetical protein
VRLYVETWKLAHERLFADHPLKAKEACSSVIVACVVLLGDLEDRPMTSAGVARYLGMAESTVRAKLKLLVEMGQIERRIKGQHCYYVASAKLQAMTLARAEKFGRLMLKSIEDIMPSLQAWPRAEPRKELPRTPAHYGRPPKWRGSSRFALTTTTHS